MSLTQSQARYLFIGAAALVVGYAGYTYLNQHPTEARHLKEQAKDAASQVKDQASHLKDQASHLTDDLKAKAGGAAGRASTGNDPKAVAAAKKAAKDAFTPAGDTIGLTTPDMFKADNVPSTDSSTWSDDDMKKFLSSRNLEVAHSSHEELQAMVQSKLNEPTATGFNDPNEWSEDDMRSWLKENKIEPGHASRMELLAMVESKMHEPTSTGFNDPNEWSEQDMKDWLKEKNIDFGHAPNRMELLAMVESKMHEPK